MLNLNYSTIDYVALLSERQQKAKESKRNNDVMRTMSPKVSVPVSRQRSVSFVSSISRSNTHQNESRPNTDQTVMSEGNHGLLAAMVVN